MSRVALVVGRVGRAHGTRGEATVELRTDSPELRFAPGAALTTDPEAVGPLTVQSIRWQSGRLLAKFAGVNDRTAAGALANTLLLVEVDPEERPTDPEEFYDHQLLDLLVVTKDGAAVGRVEQMLHLPGQDLIAVRRPGGAELLVPFIKKFVPTIDLEEKVLVIDPPDGLLDPEPQ